MTTDLLKCHLMKCMSSYQILETWTLLKLYTWGERRDAMQRCSKFYRAFRMELSWNSSSSGWGWRSCLGSQVLWFSALISLPLHHSPSLFLIFLTRVWEYCSKHWRRQNLLYFICHLWNSTLWFLIGWNWRPTWNHLWEKHCKSGEGLSSEYCVCLNPNLCDPIGFSLEGSRRNYQGFMVSFSLLMG